MPLAHGSLGCFHSNFIDWCRIPWAIPSGIFLLSKEACYMFFMRKINWSAYSLIILALMPTGPRADIMVMSSIASFISLSVIVISERLFHFVVVLMIHLVCLLLWWRLICIVGLVCWRFFWIFLIFTSCFQRSYFICIFSVFISLKNGLGLFLTSF